MKTFNQIQITKQILTAPAMSLLLGGCLKSRFSSNTAAAPVTDSSIVDDTNSSNEGFVNIPFYDSVSLGIISSQHLSGSRVDLGLLDDVAWAAYESKVGILRLKSRDLDGNKIAIPSALLEEASFRNTTGQPPDPCYLLPVPCPLL